MVGDGGGSRVRLRVIRLAHAGVKSRGHRVCLDEEDGYLVHVAGNGLLKEIALLPHKQRRGKLGDRDMGNGNYSSIGVEVCYARVSVATEWSRSMAQRHASRRLVVC